MYYDFLINFICVMILCGIAGVVIGLISAKFNKFL